MASAILAIAKQSAKGVPAATPSEQVPLSGGASPASAKVALTSGGVSASQRFPLSAYVPDLRVVGDPEIILRPNVVGLLLYGALGVKAVSGAGDPWTHTFTVGTTQPWLTFWRQIGGIITERFSDCKVASLRISSQAGRPVRVTVGIIGITSAIVPPDALDGAAGFVWGVSSYGGGDVYDGAIGGAILEVDHPMIHWHGRGAYLVEGVAVASIDDWDVTIDTGAEARDTLAAYDVRTGSRIRVTARVSQVVTNDDLWNRHVYGSASPAEGTEATLTPLELASSGLSFKLTEQAAPERSLKLDIPRVVLASLPSSAVDTQNRPIRHQAVYEALKPSAGSGITATLKNARSAY